ncbi:MAG: hypothetical protein HQL94_03420 [Magnetococcales bacterium]|nr:hypothetical protein [Magnetococcales bacterium]
MTVRDNNALEIPVGVALFRSGIARKLTLLVLLFSSIITLIGTFFQLYMDYRYDVNRVSVRFEEIRSTHLESIIHQLWVTDTASVLLLMEGILRLPDIHYLEIVRPNAPTLTVGELGVNVIERNFPLRYSYRDKSIDLGLLRIQANLSAIYQRLMDKLLIILVTQAVKTFLVSTFILLLFYYLVGRHLIAIAEHSRVVSLEESFTPIRLNRRLPSGGPDELDRLVESLNQTSAGYFALLTELSTTNHALQQEIKERETAERALQNYRDHLEEMIRIRSGELIVAKERADAASQSKSLFLANMSHELRTPINAILGFAQFIARDPDVTPKQKEYLDIIFNSGAHLLDIINEILDLAKIESGRMVVEYTDIDLSGMLHDLTSKPSGNNWLVSSLKPKHRTFPHCWPITLKSGTVPVPQRNNSSNLYRPA